MLTQEYLKSRLSYDPDTGIFRWVSRGKRGSRIIIGSEAGWDDGGGYIKIQLGESAYRAHRLAWLYVYGHFPDGILDHINRDKSDNRLCNLRLVSKEQNTHNRNIMVTNSSGRTGVRYDAQRKCWRARGTLRGKSRWLCRVKTFEEACRIREAYEKTYQPYRPREQQWRLPPHED